MTFFWGNTRLANSTQHSSETLKKSTKKLPTDAVQSAVKVKGARGEAEESCPNKGEREKGRESNRNRFEAGFSGTHCYSFLTVSK
jgi:hypothetical protein